MSNEERVLRKGDSTLGYPLSPRPDSLYQSVLSIPGVKGPWDLSTTGRGDICKSICFGRDWIETQSGHTDPDIVLPMPVFEHVVRSQEMSEYAHNLERCRDGDPYRLHGANVCIPRRGEKFHATAVPMLVAPSVERPLWKVVFTDAIGETEPPKPRVSEDPAKESGLCIGGPLRGRYFSCAPKGYRTSVELLEKTSYVFFLHEATIAGPMNAMYMLRECYGKPKKEEAKDTLTFEEFLGITAPLYAAYQRGQQARPGDQSPTPPTFEEAKDICQDCVARHPTGDNSCLHAKHCTTHRVIAVCTHFAAKEAPLNALCWECVSWAQIKPGALKDNTEGQCDSARSPVEYARAARKRCMAFEARDDETAIKLANGETCGDCDMWQFADVTKETGRCLRLSGSIWYSSAVPACDNFKVKP